VEVACDVNAELINFYHVLVDTPKLVIEQVKQTSFGRETFDAAKAAGDQGDELTRAVNFLIRHRMSYSGIGKTWAEDYKKERRWGELPYYLEPTARRLQGVKILLGSAFDVIPEYDSSETWFYLDPTYYGPTRVSEKMYDYEMSPIDHARLLEVVKRLQGKVILSGYAIPLYDEALKAAGWERVEKHLVTYSSPHQGSKAKRTEVFWVKP
jgi:DNA adenine methylase